MKKIIKSLDEIIKISMDGQHEDHSFKFVYPNFPRKEIFDGDTKSLEDLYAECKLEINKYCKDFGTRHGLEILKCEFNDPNYPDKQSPHRAFLHGLYVSIACELEIRYHYNHLRIINDVTDVTFYEKPNWGKCILFTYKGEILMASGDEYYRHNENQYSLYSANPNFQHYKSKL